MTVVEAHLKIYQGATFREAFACSLADHGLANIQTFATGPNTFDLSVGLKGDANYRLVCSGTMSAATNSVTLDIDEAVTALMSDATGEGGRFVVEVSNGTDRWRIMQGSYELVRDAA